MKTILNKLILEIENRRDELLLKDLNLDNERIDYLNEFFDKYSGKRVTSLAYLTPKELLLAILLEKNRDQSFSDLSEEVELLTDIIHQMEGIEFYKINDLTKMCDLEKYKEILENYIEESNVVKKVKHERNAKKELENEMKQHEMEFNLRGYNSIDIIRLMLTLNKIQSESYIILMCFLLDLEMGKEISKRMGNMFNLSEDDESFIEFHLKNSVNRKVLEKSMDPLYKYYLSLEKEQNQKERERTRQSYQYAEVLTILKGYSENKKNNRDKQEIIDIDRVLDKLPEEELRNLYLRYIYEHNLPYYQGLEEEYKYKTENSIGKYILYFNNLGIDFNELSEAVQKEIMLDPLELIKEKFKLLKEIFKDNKVIMSLIGKTTLPIIKELDKYRKKGYLTTKLLQENYSVYSNGEEFENLKENIVLLNKEKINITSLEDKSLLLISNSQLITNINILKLNGIDLTTLKNLMMLIDNSLQEKIDSLVEIGLEEMVKTKPEILNSDINLAKRIVISRLIGEEVIEKDSIREEILDKDRFFVTDSMVSSYLLDREHSNYNNKNIIVFPEIEAAKLSYNIEGVIIPKARVNNLKVSLESLIKPSMYSEKEIKILEKHSKVEK